MPKIAIQEITLYYERTGTGIPLLMLHGLGSCCADWVYQVPFFSKKYDVITLDLCGHGRSDKNSRFYDIPKASYIVKEFLDALGVEKAHVLGLSYGSFVALQLALDYPEKVLSLVLTGATSNARALSRWQLYLRYLLVTFCPMTVVGKILAYALFPDDEKIRKLCSARIASNKKSDYKKLCQSVLKFNVTSRLKELQCPVLLIYGENDIVLPRVHVKDLAREIPHCEVKEIKNSSHAPCLDQPETFNIIVNNFLFSFK